MTQRGSKSFYARSPHLHNTDAAFMDQDVGDWKLARVQYTVCINMRYRVYLQNLKPTNKNVRCTNLGIDTTFRAGRISRLKQ